MVGDGGRLELGRGSGWTVRALGRVTLPLGDGGGDEATLHC